MLGDTSLPELGEVYDQVTNVSPQSLNIINSIFYEMQQFEFVKTMSSPQQLSAALFVAFYRIYVLVTRPHLRAKNVQIASTLEEMLAVLAINHLPTNLFFATRPWVLDYETEGFSQFLAELIKNLDFKL